MDYITLNDGNKMPNIGLGVFRLADPKECEELIKYAISVGYRMIDTAQVYGNEEAVGNAIKNCGVPREELFITTKLCFKDSDNALEAIQESLRKLQTSYIDLLMIHWPYGNYYHAYRVMEELKEKGIVKSIGVCNFDPDRIVDLCYFNKVVPAVNQIEMHVYCQRKADLKWHEKYNITTEAYAPLGQGKVNQIFNEPILVDIAKKYNKTTAQVMLKFLSQQGVVIIPKSAHKERIKENFEIFDFTLTEEEMNLIGTLDKVTPIGGKAENPERAHYLIVEK